MPEAFLAIAYRWGETNNHHYIIYCGGDEQKAVACASAECDDRGGKYGCVVYGYKDAGAEQDVRKVAYFPSSLDGQCKCPGINYRRDMYYTLGHAFHDYAKGTAWLPEDSPDLEDKNGDPVKILKPHKAQPPQWVIDRVATEERICEVMSKMELDRNKKCPE